MVLFIVLTNIRIIKKKQFLIMTKGTLINVESKLKHRMNKSKNMKT